MITEHRERAQLRVTNAGRQWLSDHSDDLLPFLTAFLACFPETAALACCEPNPIGSFIDLCYQQLDKCAPLITLPPEAREAMVAKFTSFFVESLNNPTLKAGLASEGITYDIKFTAFNPPKGE